MTDECYDQIVRDTIERHKIFLRNSNVGSCGYTTKDGGSDQIVKDTTERQNRYLLKQESAYHKEFTNRMIATKTADVYDVLNMFSVTCPMVQHALKKLLVTGGRSGGKSEIQDLKEAAMSIEQAIQELTA